MKVILLQNTKGVGRVNDVVEVADGFARNFLFRRSLAKAASAAALAGLERQRAVEQARSRAAADRARGLVGKVETLNLEVSLPGSATGSLYAALKESEILARLRKSVPGLPDKTKLVDYVPVKASGPHELKLELVEGVRASLKLTVSADVR